MLTVMSALVVVCASLVLSEYLSTRESMRNGLELLAAMTAENSVAALSFDDAAAARELLHGLKMQPAVTAACLYSARGAPFAAYLRADVSETGSSPTPLPHPAAFGAGRLTVLRPVNFQDQAIGWLYVESDLRELDQGVRQALLIALGVMALAGIAAYFLAARLQRLISSPVIHLAQTAKAVTLFKNYGIRARKETDDELGMLIDGFNEMLAEIQRRDSEIARHQEGLEDEIADRTAELRNLNREIVGARDRAEEGSRAKTEFLANMSHELRTPINAILGLTGLTLESGLPPQHHEFLLTIRSSADSLLKVVNDILDFSKVEAGKLELDSMPFRPRECVESVVNLAAVAAQEKGLDLDWSLDSRVPEHVVGDPMRLRQVLLNLTGNALKFTPQGRVSIEVAALSRQQGTAILKFAVRDTGIGISIEKQRTIFDAFSQADGSMSRKFGGTGLGLTISSRLVTLMGGFISVESRPGQGSCFHFTIPVTVGQQDETPLPQTLPAVSPPPATPESGSALQILIAEDNPVNQKVVAAILRKRGHQVALAGNGREAVAALAQSRFDAVLMDMQMPEMSGYEATVTIRRAERESGLHVPIIAMTANSTKGDKEHCLACGMDAYLAKPLSADELIRTLETLSRVS